jgi:hypothetical protein
MFRISILTLILTSAISVFAQSEMVDNRTIIDMTSSGLSSEIILKKIASSQTKFDVSAASLIELKKVGVDDNVIAAMMERYDGQQVSKSEPAISESGSQGYSESGPPSPVTPKESLTAAKTIAFGKSSLQPSRQALEKELLKRKDFQRLNLTILRYKESADLYVDIGFVSGSWITHRYVYRIYDRHSGAVIAAGETTSWGSLAENLARHIAKSLLSARTGSTT